jgi:hypothetical protein
MAVPPALSGSDCSCGETEFLLRPQTATPLCRSTGRSAAFGLLDVRCWALCEASGEVEMIRMRQCKFFPMDYGVWKIGIALVLGSICCGCQTTYDTSAALADYRNAKPCCSDFAEISFEKLPYDKNVNVTVSSTGQAYRFDDGLSYFKAFELPTISTKSAVIVESTQFSTPASGTVYFYPVLAVLDDQKQLIATIDRFSEAEVVEGYIHSNSPSTLEIGFLSNDYPNARYVVLHTTAIFISNGHKIHYKLPVLNVDVLGSEITGEPVRSDATVFRPGSPVAPKGTLDIRVVPAN